MRKQTPQHKLSIVQAELVLRGIDGFTRTALDDVAQRDLRPIQALVAVQTLTKKTFLQVHDHLCTPHRMARRARLPHGSLHGLRQFTLRTDGSIVISFEELRP